MNNNNNTPQLLEQTPHGNYNPDVLSCLANLSSDEVFTPPDLANNMLDLLPKEIWSNKKTTFLDPMCKSGVFLREIAKRLNAGLAEILPDKQERINHILTKQVFGIAITELTALISRRTLYCSRFANGAYSVCSLFETEQGNILYAPIKHTWKNGKCVFCGASENEYERGESLESHAYPFIHTTNPEEIFNMKFDVIIGNPPYQMSDGGGGIGTSAKPLYQKFVEQAKKLNPRFFSMIIPARWLVGGKGLNEFREEMLHDTRISTLVDYFDASDIFTGVDISGGVCYFLWNRDNHGDCTIVSMNKNNYSISNRPLLEYDVFIRFNEAVSIVKKSKSLNEECFAKEVASRKPFGLPTNAKIFKSQQPEMIKVYAYPENGYISRDKVLKNSAWINKYKVCVANVYGERGSFPYLVLGKPFIVESGACSTETYIVLRVCDDLNTAKNVQSYVQTRFFRFLTLLIKNTPNATQRVYSFVPIQDFSQEWTDEKLYAKYGLNEEEIAFIESMVRPMDLSAQNAVAMAEEGNEGNEDEAE